MTRAELTEKLKALGKMSKEERNGVVCALIGHSNIVKTCFGYVYCGRCGTQVGDSLGGVYRNEKVVVIGHNCPTCRENYAKLTWEDKVYVRNPFTKEV